MLLIFLTVLFSCEEKLPEKVEPTDLVTGKIRLANDNPYVTIRWGLTDPGLTTFLLGVENKFDETLDGPMDIQSKIDIFLEEGDGLKLIQTIQYNYKNPDRNITIDRGKTFWQTLVWNQFDKDNQPLWKYIDPQTDAVENSTLSIPLKLTAKGEFKVFTNVTKVKTEMNLQVRYIIR